MRSREGEDVKVKLGGRLGIRAGVMVEVCEGAVSEELVGTTVFFGSLAMLWKIARERKEPLNIRELKLTGRYSSSWGCVLLPLL